jgi:flagellar basal body-associated protein FliL
MKLILPIVLAVLGLVGGAGAGWYFKPAPPEEHAACRDAQGHETTDPDACGAPPEPAKKSGAHEDPKEASQFITLDRQFIVPIVSENKVSAMMVMTINLEVGPGKMENAFRNEPKLRDALLRALFEHAYSGGFNGDFTAEHVVRELRKNLLAAGQGIIGADLRSVLIADMIRQEQ